jgi:signal transduction histidine kinase
VKLRLRLALVSCAVALVATGATGALLVQRSRVYSTEQLLQKQQLLAQNRAFALGDSLDVALRELTRLSHMAEVDLSDNDLRPEAQLLAHAHRNSTLFNIGLRIYDATGRCLWSEPKSRGCDGEEAAGAVWFVEGRKAHGAVVVGEAPQSGLIDLAVPIGGTPGAAAGVLRGIIDPTSDRIVAPALRDLLTAGTEAALVSQRGRLIHPATLRKSGGWERALAAAPGPSDAFRQTEDGQEWLYAHAPVAHAGWGLVFRWPWAALDDGLERQKELLWRIVALGGLLSVLLSLLSSRWQAQPLESLVRARTAELETAQRSLLAQERLAAMGQAAAVISHELKNSLGALGMGVDLIAREAGGAGLGRVHTQVREEVARLRTLTDELLVFARTPVVEKREHELGQLVQRAVGLCAEQAAAEGVQLDLRPPLVPLRLVCDGERILSVLVNLVHNAVEAVAWQAQPAAGAPARQRAVRVGWRSEGGAAVLTIEDGGPGVALEARAHLFEPFFTTKRNGTGLGLATAQRFLGAHGGRLEVDSSPELGGARFTVVLPGPD